VTRRPLIILAAIAIVFGLLLSPVAGWNGGGGNANFQYGECGCHSTASSATVEMSASSTSLTPGQQTTVTVAVNGGQGNGKMMGVMLLSKMSGTSGTLPQENGWTIVTNGGGQANNYYEVGSYTGSASFTWTLKAPSAGGAYKLYAKVENSAGTAYTKDYTSGLSFTVASVMTVPPMVQITAPTSGATVSGSMIVSATATPGSGQSIASVELKIDGIVVGAKAAAPYSWTINTNTYANTAHTILVTAIDGGGNKGTAQSTFTVNNSPLSVTISSPTNGATVVGTVNVAASASGQQAISKIDISIDGTLKATLTASPYAWAWDTASLADGQHTVTVTATESGGATASQSVTVTVNNQGRAVLVPAVTITDPLNGGQLKGIAGINATVSSNVALTNVELLVDGLAKVNLTSGPYLFTVDTLTYADGAHSIQIRATDRNGGVGQQTITTFFTNPAPVVLIQTPSEGALVSGTINVTALIQGSAITNAVLKVDGASVGTLTAGPFLWVIDTTILSDGAHAINITATDGRGRTASANLTVLVSNAVPNIILADLSADLVGIVPIVMNLSGVVTVRCVEVYLDSSLVCNLSSIPYQCAVDTTTVSNGAHVIEVHAITTSGAVARAVANVTVRNIVSVPPGQFEWKLADMGFAAIIGLLVVGVIAGRRWKR
jgi:hypothetical protein